MPTPANPYDPDFTRLLQQWLNTPDDEKDIAQGALLLLRIDRNRVLYSNILRNPEGMMPKLVHELQKYLQIRLDGLTRREILEMQNVLLPEVAKTVGATAEKQPAPETARHAGKRPDHDQLPVEVQALWNDNETLFFKMKQLYNLLLTMENKKACDRYEYLKQLKEADQIYRQNLSDYDAAAPQQPTKLDRAVQKQKRESIKKDLKR